MLLGPVCLSNPAKSTCEVEYSILITMELEHERETHRVRSRSCGTLSDHENTSNLKKDARRKGRSFKHSFHKRRNPASIEDSVASKMSESQVELSPSQDPYNISRKLSRKKHHSSSSVLEGSSRTETEDSENSHNCTAITTYIVDDDRPFLSVTDLSTVYKSLELLNGYLALQGYSPYETAFLSDPRVTEILSHIQHGCPLARRPSKHLPSIDSTILPIIDWAEARVPLKSDLSQLLVDRIHAYIHTDIEILIGREVFCCHSLVLQCYSTYFDDVGGASKVHLPEEQVSGRAFHTMYDWMISPDANSYARVLKRENIIEMLSAAQFLGVHELEEQCWAFINSNSVFLEESAFLLYLEARKANNKPVMELMLPKVQKFFLKLVSTVDFLTMDSGALCAVLGSNFIAVHNEMEVFMAAVLWLTYDWSKRRSRVVEVMQQVRFGWLEPWQIVDIRRNYSSNPEYIRVTQNTEVRRMMEEGLAFATTRTACGGDWARLRHLVEALCLTEPAARHWLTGDATYPSFQSFIESLPKYREPDALDTMEFRVEGDWPPFSSVPPPNPASHPLSSSTSTLLPASPTPTKTDVKIKEDSSSQSSSTTSAGSVVTLVAEGVSKTSGVKLRELGSGSALALTTKGAEDDGRAVRPGDGRGEVAARTMFSARLLARASDAVTGGTTRAKASGGVGANGTASRVGSAGTEHAVASMGSTGVLESAPTLRTIGVDGKVASVGTTDVAREAGKAGAVVTIGSGRTMKPLRSLGEVETVPSVGVQGAMSTALHTMRIMATGNAIGSMGSGDTGGPEGTVEPIGVVGGAEGLGDKVDPGGTVGGSSTLRSSNTMGILRSVGAVGSLGTVRPGDVLAARVEVGLTGNFKSAIGATVFSNKSKNTNL